MADEMKPVCYVCQAQNNSVRTASVQVEATIHLKSPVSRAQTIQVKVCGRCWGEAPLSKIAGSERP